METSDLGSDLKAQLVTAIEAGIAAECGYATPNNSGVKGIAKGIADALIPFLLKNFQTK